MRNDARRIAVAVATAARSLGLHVDPLTPSSTADPFATVAVPEGTPLHALVALQLVPAAVDLADLDRALASAVVRSRVSILVAAVFPDETRRRRMMVEAWREVRAFLVASAPEVERLAARLACEPLQPHELPCVDWPTLSTAN